MDFYAEDVIRLSPYKDDKWKYAENTPFWAGSDFFRLPIVKLCFKSVFENLADHFPKYGFQVSDILYLHQREQFPQFLSPSLFCCPYLRAVFVLRYSSERFWSALLRN